ILQPILIGPTPKSAPDGVTYIDPAGSPLASKYAALYYERRRAKGITQVEAAGIALRPLYFAALMVAAGDADGSVGGAVNTTAETVRAALHCIGVGPDARLVSGFFVMIVPQRAADGDGLAAFHGGPLLFADCAVVPDP